MKRVFLYLFFTVSLLANGPIEPIDPAKHLNLLKVELGKILFFDPNLSSDSKTSCASCHKKEHGGSNGKRFARGVYDREVALNVPSIYNLKYQYVYGWLKKEYDLKKKIELIMTDPDIMDADFEKIKNYIQKTPFLSKRFSYTYSKVDKESIIDALYNYLLSLTTTGSKFDRYLKGEIELDPEEKRGFELFKRYGCIACHNGRSVGGHLYFKYGYFLEGKEQKYVKCPSLRNVEYTAPYFHTGAVKDLKEAVKWMAKVQLGREISDRDCELIVKFLKTLSGTPND